MHGGGGLQTRHVHDDAVGDVRREGLDVQLAGHVLDHAALLRAGCLLAALQVHGHRGLDLLVEADLEQVEVDDLVPDRVALLVLDDHRERAAAVDLQVEHGGAGDQGGAQVAPADLERGALAVPAAVDDAGHVALPPEAPSRARTALLALLDGK